MAPKKSASFVQLTRVAGRIGKKKGSFVLQSTGAWDGATSLGTWHVVPDSGRGELSGLHGKGGWTARGEDYPDVQDTLDYDFKSSRAREDPTPGRDPSAAASG